jgi:hypothetical protein
VNGDTINRMRVQMDLNGKEEEEVCYLSLLSLSFPFFLLHHWLL